MSDVVTLSAAETNDLLNPASDDTFTDDEDDDDDDEQWQYDMEEYDALMQKFMDIKQPDFESYNPYGGTSNHIIGKEDCVAGFEYDNYPQRSPGEVRVHTHLEDVKEVTFDETNHEQDDSINLKDIDNVTFQKKLDSMGVQGPDLIVRGVKMTIHPAPAVSPRENYQSTPVKMRSSYETEDVHNISEISSGSTEEEVAEEIIEEEVVSEEAEVMPFDVEKCRSPRDNVISAANLKRIRDMFSVNAEPKEEKDSKHNEKMIEGEKTLHASLEHSWTSSQDASVLKKPTLTDTVVVKKSPTKIEIEDTWTNAPLFSCKVPYHRAQSESQTPRSPKPVLLMDQSHHETVTKQYKVG